MASIPPRTKRLPSEYTEELGINGKELEIVLICLCLSGALIGSNLAVYDALGHPDPYETSIWVKAGQGLFKGMLGIMTSPFWVPGYMTHWWNS